MCILKGHFSCYAENGLSDFTAVVKQKETGGPDDRKNIVRMGNDRGAQICETLSE